jgi:hypothetical protein
MQMLFIFLSMKRASTLFLKAVLILIGAVVLIACVISFPHAWQGGPQEAPQFTSVILLGITGIYAAAFPFLFALYQAFMLLRYIDANNAFSDLSEKSLKIIKHCAIAMSILYASALPLAFVIAELDDAPGVVVIATAFACAPLVVATFAAVLQKLIRSAIDMKLENDLTV